LKLCISNLKSREKAITSIRKVLRSYQLNENVIVLDTYFKITAMRDIISRYYRY